MKEDIVWGKFHTETFIFCEREARIIYPETKPNGKIILKTEYWDAFPNAEIAMLEKFNINQALHKFYPFLSLQILHINHYYK